MALSLQAEDEGFAFTIERIVAKRLVGAGRVEYLVRWKGYDAGDDTWEKAKDMRTARRSELVRLFESSNETTVL